MYKSGNRLVGDANAANEGLLVRAMYLPIFKYLVTQCRRHGSRIPKHLAACPPRNHRRTMTIAPRVPFPFLRFAIVPRINLEIIICARAVIYSRCCTRVLDYSEKVSTYHPRGGSFIVLPARLNLYTREGTLVPPIRSARAPASP